MLGAGLLAGREVELNLIIFPTALPALAGQLGLGWSLMGKYRVKIEGRINEVNPLMGVLPILKAKGWVTKCQVILGPWWYFFG